VALDITQDRGQAGVAMWATVPLTGKLIAPRTAPWRDVTMYGVERGAQTKKRHGFHRALNESLQLSPF